MAVACINDGPVGLLSRYLRASGIWSWLGEAWLMDCGCRLRLSLKSKPSLSLWRRARWWGMALSRGQCSGRISRYKSPPVAGLGYWLSLGPYELWWSCRRLMHGRVVAWSGWGHAYYVAVPGVFMLRDWQSLVFAGLTVAIGCCEAFGSSFECATRKVRLVARVCPRIECRVCSHV